LYRPILLATTPAITDEHLGIHLRDRQKQYIQDPRWQHHSAEYQLATINLQYGRGETSLALLVGAASHLTTALAGFRKGFAYSID